MIDTLRATSPQRWVLCLFAVTAPLAASILIATGSGVLTTGSVVLLGLLAVWAIAAAAYPNAHTGLAIIGIIGWQWIASVDDVATSRTLAVALCLLVMHSALALMAVTPYTAVIERTVLTRSARRTAAVFVPTVVVWLIVVAFERIETPGNTLLVFLALSIVVAGVIMLSRFGDRHQSSSDS